MSESAQIYLEEEGWDEIGAFYDTLGSEVHVRFMRELYELVEEMVFVARGLAPIRTGQYHDSIHWEQDTPESYIVLSDVDYADIVEFGSPPHPIDGNPLLTFYSELYGKVISVPHVEHTGYTGRFILSQAFDYVWDKCYEKTAQALDDIMDP